ncbi:YybH family protein [Williamsia sp.]|uniref:YybH family protein n=1 Tax=Williamsia sp. TaxID=1872085 RepID=UPI002F921D6A
MSDDTEDIRVLLNSWAQGVHTGDLDTVLADHSSDIVMFDVPPPHNGIRGIDEYRRSWPQFFEWQAGGATFDIVDMDISAGSDVAFAHMLLRCGTAQDFADDPDRRLRLTVGLRKDNARWTVTHEHHSFAIDIE